MKDAGKIALAVVNAAMTWFIMTQANQILSDVRALRVEQQKQAVVIGSVIAWAQTKGYQQYTP